MVPELEETAEGATIEEASAEEPIADDENDSASIEDKETTENITESETNVEKENESDSSTSVDKTQSEEKSESIESSGKSQLAILKEQQTGKATRKIGETEFMPINSMAQDIRKTFGDSLVINNHRA